MIAATTSVSYLQDRWYQAGWLTELDATDRFARTICDEPILFFRVWMGQPERADAALLPDFSFIDKAPQTAKVHGYMPTRANYQLLSDNILDLSHTNYLHLATIGCLPSNTKMRVAQHDDRVSVRWTSASSEVPAVLQPSMPGVERADFWTEVN